MLAQNIKYLDFLVNYGTFEGHLSEKSFFYYVIYYGSINARIPSPSRRSSGTKFWENVYFIKSEEVLNSQVSFLTFELL